MSLSLKQEFSSVSPEELAAVKHARILNFKEVKEILASPDTKEKLSLEDSNSYLFDSKYQYPVKEGQPILYPNIITSAFLANGLDFEYYSESKLQYFLLSQIKQRGEINAPATSMHYQRHLYRMKKILNCCKGLVLDIGCDDVQIGASLFSEDCEYVGLDPFSTGGDSFKVVGVGEALPFANEIFDAVAFNTSLDHILDYHLGIEEAFRVLKVGGVLVISTLIWTDKNASLLNDAVHFHHFRDYEILGTVQKYGEIMELNNYPYKEDEHRYGMYISVKKQENNIRSNK